MTKTNQALKSAREDFGKVLFCKRTFKRPRGGCPYVNIEFIANDENGRETVFSMDFFEEGSYIVFNTFTGACDTYVENGWRIK